MKNVRLILPLIAALVAVGMAVRYGNGQAAPTSRSPVASPQLVILDTDIGDDIDDAFALALALRSPELKILGVTTAFGDTELRARLVSRYLDAAGRSDIPVTAGVETKTDNVLTQAAYARQGPRFSTLDPLKEWHYLDGVDFLLDQIRRYPGQITLIAIGPLFNVQAAIERDPATFKKLRRVVMMGGSINRGYDGRNGEHRPPDTEWNISRDPAGAKALFAAGVPIFMMPLDSTQIRLETAKREAIFAHGSPLTDQLTLLYHQWRELNPGHATTPTLFDPVAVTYAIRPDLCPASPMRIEVDDKGFTRSVPGTPNAQVCLRSDEKEFLKFMLSRVTGE